ncbi:MAG TPA: T9SS type A sorting domain-containing protein [Candidatus Cloacimonadota bacterium]|nr:T9SS type A sorting domain-containing protein [Candidatus Cloacimonadota bacterium]
MKKLLLLMLALSLMGMIFADIMQPGESRTPVQGPSGYRVPAPRTESTFTFSTPPTALLTNFYDYMIGGYNGLPIKVIPESAGGGYFMTYHGRRQPTSTRRVFYTYIGPTGVVINNNEITETQIAEGFASLAVDPVSGKPLYAWHSNVDTDTNTETMFVADAFMSGIAGLFDTAQILCNAPIVIDPPSFNPTSDNEFIWPTNVIGPSPVAGKRRIYVLMRNYVTHAANPSENVYIAFADFDASDLEMDTTLVWSYTTIPTLDDWNHDGVNWRRPQMAVAADDNGNLYYSGYHYATDAEDNTIDEPDMDVFVCNNYGQGTWTRYTHYSNLATWNPPATQGGTVGYFTNDAGTAYADDALSWNIANSSHLNAEFDAQGKLHVPALWALSTNEGTYYPNMQFVKQFTFDPTTHDFAIMDVYPQKDPTDTHNVTFTPWDTEAPWGEVDSYLDDGAGGVVPAIQTDWNFPLWDASASADAMTFHYNGIKITKANSHGMMAMVWQNSWRARMYNYYSDTDYSAWANVPEIYIAVSDDNGVTWCEPMVLNNIETPAMAGIKPMYVYPADQMVYVGNSNGIHTAKLGLMFYDDYTWGAFVQTPPYHPTCDGGRTMFMELLINCPTSGNDPVVPAVSNMLSQNYPNPFNPETTISFDLPLKGDARLDIYNVRGQLVKTLANGILDSGRHNLVWNGLDEAGQPVSSGMYFSRLSYGNHTESRKMMLVK